MNKHEIEKAIETLEDMKGVFDTRSHKQYSLPALGLAISALEHQLANGWIPVEKELPKFTDDYLASVTISTSFGDFDTVRTLPFYRRDGKGEWLLPKNFDEVWKVRAWRELPEPYKNISEEVI